MFKTVRHSMVCICDCCNKLLVVVGGVVLAKVVLSTVYSVVSRFFKRRSLNKISQWAVVTGASDGIGKAMATELAYKGINLVLVARSQERLDDSAKTIIDAALSKGKKIEVRTVTVDFSSTDDSTYDTIRSKTNDLEIGILINNVGISYPHAMYYNELSSELINNLIDINIRSVFKTTHIFYDMMRNRKKGMIVNVASAAATLPSDPLYAGYAGVKAAIECFSRNLSIEAAASNIIVQCHAPLLVTSKLSKVRSASFFSPSPSTYAKTAITAMENRLSDDVTISPYFGHQLQMFVAHAVPECVWQFIRFKMTKDIRTRAIKAASRKAQENAKTQ